MAEVHRPAQVSPASIVTIPIRRPALPATSRTAPRASAARVPRLERFEARSRASVGDPDGVADPVVERRRGRGGRTLPGCAASTPAGHAGGRIDQPSGHEGRHAVSDIPGDGTWRPLDRLDKAEAPPAVTRVGQGERRFRTAGKALDEREARLRPAGVAAERAEDRAGGGVHPSQQTQGQGESRDVVEDESADRPRRRTGVPVLRGVERSVRYWLATSASKKACFAAQCRIRSRLSMSGSEDTCAAEPLVPVETAAATEPMLGPFGAASRSCQRQATSRRRRGVAWRSQALVIGSATDTPGSKVASRRAVGAFMARPSGRAVRCAPAGR